MEDVRRLEPLDGTAYALRIKKIALSPDGGVCRTHRFANIDAERFNSGPQRKLHGVGADESTSACYQQTRYRIA
jgi:hypothetical protein